MLGKIEEMKLLALCMATDNREAFSRLVDAYSEGVRRFLMNMTGGDAALTDDLSQETFIKAWLAVRSFKGLSSFKTWLYRIAANEFISYRRKRFVDSELSLTDNVSTMHEPLHSPQSAIDASMDVATLLKMLPDNERMVCLLFYIEDQPVKKISKILSMPEGTVKSHLNRGRSHLATLVNN